MGLKDRFINAAINEIAPEALGAYIDEHLSNKKSKEVRAFLVEHRYDDLYEFIPEKGKRAIMKLAPTKLDWLTCQWLVQRVSKTNPAVASMVLGSPELRGIINDQLKSLKGRIHETQI